MSNPYRSGDAYLREELMTLSPVGLICRVLQATHGVIEKARRHAEAGRHAACRTEIDRARALVSELRAALDHAQGGDIAKRLEALYEFICSCLLRPSGRADLGDLREAQRLILTIKEGFDAVLAKESHAHA